MKIDTNFVISNLITSNFYADPLEVGGNRAPLYIV